MGLALPALRFLAREHVQSALGGPVLLLGRQDVAGSPIDALRILTEEGIVPDAAAKARLCDPAKPPAHTISDVDFFGLLGLDDLRALDYSDYEKAEIIHDLNRPIPNELADRFGLVIDGGTLEHVFDVRQALMNVARLVRPGGRIIHLSPANNYLNHGFYQFSPTLFHDFYRANGFADLQGLVFLRGRLSERTSWKVYELNPARQSPLASTRPMLLIFTATRTADSTATVVPQQSFYEEFHKRPGLDGDWRQRLVRRMPLSLRRFLLQYVPGPHRRGYVTLLGKLRS